MRPHAAFLLLGWACSSSSEKPVHIVPTESGTPVADSGAADTGPAAADSGTHAPDTGLPTVEVDPPPASLSAEEVATAIGEALAGGIPEPLSARLAYINALSHRDAFCPGGGDLSIIGEWAGCTAESGWQFAGYTEYTGETDPFALSDFHLLADFRFHDPAGHLFIGGGELDLDEDTDGGDRAWTSQVSGTFSYAEAPGWMAPDGASATLAATGAWTGSTWSLSLDGALNTGTHAVHLGDLTAGSDPCSAQASGTLSLRDASGYWYAIDLECGCGEVRFADTETLGSACVDLSGVLEDLALEMRP